MTAAVTSTLTEPKYLVLLEWGKFCMQNEVIVWKKRAARYEEKMSEGESFKNQGSRERGGKWGGEKQLLGNMEPPCHHTPLSITLSKRLVSHSTHYITVHRTTETLFAFAITLCFRSHLKEINRLCLFSFKVGRRLASYVLGPLSIKQVCFRLLGTHLCGRKSK